MAGPGRRAALFSLFILIPGRVLGAEYFVSKSGSDSNSCATAQSGGTNAKLTIAAGAACLGTGDTLTVAAGTYAESISNNIPAGSSWSNVTLVRANPGDAVTIRPNSGRAAEFTQNTRRYIELRGFILDGDNTGENSVVKITDGADHIRLRNLEVKDSPLAMGVLITEGSVPEGSNNNELIGCWIHSNGVTWTEGQTSGPPHGLYLSTDNNLVDGCELSNNPNGFGLHGFDGPANNTIRNLRVHDNDAGVLLDGNNNKLYNSAFWNHNFVGVQVGSGSGLVTGNKVLNNTFYDDPSGSIHVGHDNAGGPHAQGTVVENNVCWAASDGRGRIVINQDGDQSTVRFNLLRQAVVNNGTNNTITNNTIGDPLFVNAGTQNFQLQSGSPAIDAGTNLASEGVTSDADGTARPQGSAFDVGAFEFLQAGGFKSALAGKASLAGKATIK